MVEEVEKLVEIAKFAGAKELSLKVDKVKVLIRFSEDSLEHRAIVEETTSEEGVYEEKIYQNIVEVKSNFVGILKLIDKKGNPIVSEKKPVKKNDLLGYAIVLGIEHEILSPVDGIVESILLKDGDTIEYGSIIMTISSNNSFDER
jgi:biotin carboxyl carrier protein